MRSLKAVYGLQVGYLVLGCDVSQEKKIAYVTLDYDLENI